MTVQVGPKTSQPILIDLISRRDYHARRVSELNKAIDLLGKHADLLDALPWIMEAMGWVPKQ